MVSASPRSQPCTQSQGPRAISSRDDSRRGETGLTDAYKTVAINSTPHAALEALPAPPPISGHRLPSKNEAKLGRVARLLAKETRCASLSGSARRVHSALPVVLRKLRDGLIHYTRKRFRRPRFSLRQAFEIPSAARCAS